MMEEKDSKVIKINCSRYYGSNNVSTIPVADRLSTEADDFFGLLVSKHKKETRSAVAALMMIFLLKKDRKEMKNYINNILHYAGAKSPQRKEKMSNAVVAIGGPILLNKLRSKGAWI